jgi:glyoxylase-like metal-dependent hydrolase (beta-lactamase superfamily II)
VVSKVSASVVRLGSPFVNWYLLEDGGGVTVIDAGVSGYRDQLAPGCSLLGRSESDVQAVVLTHAHADHVGVAEALRQELGVPVYVHAEDEELARTSKQLGKNERSMLPYLRYPAAWKLFWELGRNGGMKPRPIGRVSAFADGEHLDVPGSLRVVHTPGHTAGHCAFVADTSGVVFAGDSICSLNPLTGERGPQLMPSAFTKSNAQALDSLDRLKGGGFPLLPGHGGPIADPEESVEQARSRGPT